MYAIVDIAGQQFKVEKNQKVFVHRIDAKEGSSVDFDEVLLVDNDGKVQVGTPTVANTFVSAKVVNHLKADKVKVFHKKRRKGYEKLNGHRQYMTEIVIEDIKEGKATNKIDSKAAPKKEKDTKKAASAPKKEATPKAEETKKVATPKAETAEKPKTAPKAKAAPKKETAAPKKKAAPKAAAKTKAAPKAKEEKDTKEDNAE